MIDFRKNEAMKMAEAYEVKITVFVKCPSCKKDVQFNCTSEEIIAYQFSSEFVRIVTKDDFSCPRCNEQFGAFLFDLDTVGDEG